MRPVAAIVLGALAVSWMILTVLDLRENDGAGPIIAMFGIPALAAAVIIQIVMARLGERKRVPKAVFWWVLAVLPLGTLAGFVVAILRDPDYFIADEGPWMLIWVPIFIVVGLLLGALVWFFFVFPPPTPASALLLDAETPGFRRDPGVRARVRRGLARKAGSGAHRRTLLWSLLVGTLIR
ncbi:hypothetical protein [Microbacterium sp. Y-01]|uniref:hypothetical protein n=1 Tax=Microbacterium sp. Y-01 TaxID=2048898 RepID=UPI000F5D63B1|nr:hypothetical protein [Microbacterium sp. Y-01]